MFKLIMTYIFIGLMSVAYADRVPGVGQNEADQVDCDRIATQRPTNQSLGEEASGSGSGTDASDR